MSLVTLSEVLKDAEKNNYAVPAFNFNLYEDLTAIVKGAEELKSPVIVMAAGSCIKHWKPELAAFMIKEVAERASVPVVAHLDHASNMDLIFQAMKAGFTSVMYDGSMLSFEENMANTKTVVKIAKALGISVEAEVGRVGKSEEGEDLGEILTEPEYAARFIEETDVTALAVAVGTVHAMQKQNAKIHHDLVEKLSAAVTKPLVLHGSSGATNEDLLKLSKTSFCKINIGTRLKTVYTERIREILAEKPELKSQIVLMQEAAPAVSETVKEKIRLLGSEGKA